MKGLLLVLLLVVSGSVYADSSIVWNYEERTLNIPSIINPQGDQLYSSAKLIKRPDGLFELTDLQEYKAPECPPAEWIKSTIDGTFEGWTGNTIVKLKNGQVWQQDHYFYQSAYAYQPNVIIFNDAGTYIMIVDGVNIYNGFGVKVKRIE